MTELRHHGILGMKWGVRRYQNADGSLTELGRKRWNKYNKKIISARSAIQKASILRDMTTTPGSNDAIMFNTFIERQNEVISKARSKLLKMNISNIPEGMIILGKREVAKLLGEGGAK